MKDVLQGKLSTNWGHVDRVRRPGVRCYGWKILLFGNNSAIVRSVGKDYMSRKAAELAAIGCAARFCIDLVE